MSTASSIAAIRLFQLCILYIVADRPVLPLILLNFLVEILGLAVLELDQRKELPFIRLYIFVKCLYYVCFYITY